MMPEISYHNTKEISLVSTCTKDDGYKDLLRISSNWISYKRKNKIQFN